MPDVLEVATQGAGPPLTWALLLAAIGVAALPRRRWGAGPTVARSSRGRWLAAPVGGTVSIALMFGLSWWSTLLIGAGAVLVARRLRARTSPLRPAELRHIAAALDVFAECVHAGLPGIAALTAAAELPIVPDGATAAFRQSAAMMALGGDEQAVWRPLAEQAELAPLAAGGRRSALGGVRLADVARETAAELRARGRAMDDAATARAGVAVTAPLALCFLPAFLCLGLAPVVIGLVGSLHLW